MSMLLQVWDKAGGENWMETDHSSVNGFLVELADRWVKLWPVKPRVSSLTRQPMTDAKGRVMFERLPLAVWINADTISHFRVMEEAPQLQLPGEHAAPTGEGILGAPTPVASNGHDNGDPSDPSDDCT